jgi:hypothetical protein
MRLGSTSLNVTNRSGGGGPLAAAAPTPTYSLTSNSTVNEGFALSNTVNTNHVADGTTLYWRIDHGTTNNDDFAAISGTTTINVPHGGTTGSGTFSINVEADALTEGNTSETFTVVISLAADGTALDSNNVSINDTSLTATYSLTAGATSVDEGSNLTFTVSTTNVPLNNILYWGIVHNTTSSSDFTTSQGQLTVNNAPNFTDTFTVTPDADQLTDPNETFDVHLYTDAARSNSVASVTGIQVGDTSTTPPPPTYAIAGIVSTVNEGGTLQFDVTTTNVANGTTLYWAAVGVNTGTANRDPATAADFVNATGSFQISGNSHTFGVQISADTTTEATDGDEFEVQLSTTQGGTAVATSQTIRINDTSQTPATPTYTMAGQGGATEVNEGSGFVIDITTTNVTGTPTLHWLIDSSSTAHQSNDFITNGYFGSVTLNSSQQGSFTVTPKADNLTEGDETFFVKLYPNSNYNSSEVLDTLGPITIRDTSKAVSWTVTATGSPVDEGNTVTINVATTGVASGTYYWNIVGAGSDPVTPADDFVAHEGSFTLTATGNVGDGTGSFTVQPEADTTTESTNAETYRVNIFTDSARTVNPAFVTNLVVNDTSQGAAYSSGTYYPIWAIRLMDYSNTSNRVGGDPEKSWRRMLSFDDTNSTAITSTDSLSSILTEVDNSGYATDPNFGRDGHYVNGFIIKHFQTDKSTVYDESEFTFNGTQFNVWQELSNSASYNGYSQYPPSLGTVQSASINGTSVVGTARTPDEYIYANVSTDTNESGNQDNWTTDNGDYLLLGVSDKRRAQISGSPDSLDTQFASTNGLAFGISDSDGLPASFQTPREGIGTRSNSYASFFTNWQEQQKNSHGGRSTVGYAVVYAKVSGHPTDATAVSTTNLSMHLDAGDSSSYSGSGTNWNDLTSNNIDGTLTNGPTYSSDNNGVLVFDGTDDYVDIGSFSGAINGGFTFESWIYPTGNSTGYFFSAGAKGLYISQGSGSTLGNFIWHYGTGTYSTTATIPLNAWSHVTCVCDTTNNDVSIYVNGSLQDKLPGNSVTQNVTRLFGSSSVSDNFAGKVSQVRLYNVRLAHHTILNNYHASNGRF